MLLFVSTKYLAHIALLLLSEEIFSPKAWRTCTIMVMSHHQKAYGRFILKLQLLLEDLLQFFRVKVDNYFLLRLVSMVFTS